MSLCVFASTCTLFDLCLSQDYPTARVETVKSSINPTPNGMARRTGRCSRMYLHGFRLLVLCSSTCQLVDVMLTTVRSTIASSLEDFETCPCPRSRCLDIPDHVLPYTIRCSYSLDISGSLCRVPPYFANGFEASAAAAIPSRQRTYIDEETLRRAANSCIAHQAAATRTRQHEQRLVHLILRRLPPLAGMTSRVVGS